jgi:hypothetical protein
MKITEIRTAGGTDPVARSPIQFDGVSDALLAGRTSGIDPLNRRFHQLIN